MALEASETALEGLPRVGPALSAYSAVDEVLRASHEAGINPYPWQEQALDIAMSIDEDWQFIYREVAIIAARQNGKSKILIPRIKWGLDHGRLVIACVVDEEHASLGAEALVTKWRAVSG